MYICEECGEVFEVPINWVEPHGEELSGCPYCKGAYVEVIECSLCGDYHRDEDLYDGICIECIKNSIDYDCALDFLEQKELLAEFLTVCWWEVAELANKVGRNALSDFEHIFKRTAASDKVSVHKPFLTAIQEYIIDVVDEWLDFIKKELNRI